MLTSGPGAQTAQRERCGSPRPSRPPAKGQNTIDEEHQGVGLFTAHKNELVDRFLRILCIEPYTEGTRIVLVIGMAIGNPK